MHRLFTPILAALLCSTPIAAIADEAWPAEEHEVRVDTDAFTAAARTQYTHTGDRIELLDPASPGTVQTVGVRFDAEFGLFEDVSIFTRTALKNVKFESEAGNAAVAGLSDLMLGGKWRFVDAPLTLTLAPAVKFPTGYTPDPGPYVPSLGNGVNEYEARIWAGKRFDDSSFYFEIGTGYRFRGTRVPRGGGPAEIYADEIPYDLEIGFEPLEKVLAIGLLEGAYSLGKAQSIDRVTLQPLVEKYTRVGFGAGYRPFKALSFLLTYRGTAAGVNTLSEQIVMLAASFRYGLAE